MSPSKNPTPCTAWPCPELRPCPVHDRAGTKERERNERREESRRVYLSARWQRVRRRLLLERPWCQWPARCHLPSTDVDHVIPIEDGGDPWDENNLTTYCKPHHSEKTAEDVRARRSGRAQRKPEPTRRPVRRRRAAGPDRGEGALGTQNPASPETAG